MMKRTILLMGLILIIGAVVGYGQEGANMQPKEDNARMEAIISLAVEDFSSYCEKIKQEREKLKGEKRAVYVPQKLIGFFKKYNDDEMLIMQQKFAQGTSESDILGKDLVIGVLSERWKDNPPVSKLLAIISDENIDGKIRAQWVAYFNTFFTNLHNQKKQVTNDVRKEVAIRLKTIFKNKNNTSVLRSKAIYTLGFIMEDTETSDLLIQAIDDNDKSVSNAAIRTVGRIPSSDKMVEKLINLLDGINNDNKEKAYAVIDTSFRIKDRNITAKLINILNTINDIDVFTTMSAKFETIEAVEPILINASRFKNNQHFYYSINAEVLNKYIEITKDSDYVDKSIELIGDYAYEDAVPALIDKLCHHQSKIRKSAIVALGKIAKTSQEKIKKAILYALNNDRMEEKESDVIDLLDYTIKNISLNGQNDHVE